MNVTARHGQGAVHLGGHEFANGRWSPACGTQHHNAGGREVTPLRPTDESVTCKRCLKVITKETANTAAKPAIDAHATAVAQMRANIDAEDEDRAAARRARNRTNYAPAPTTREDAKPFHRQVKDAINFKW